MDEKVLGIREGAAKMLVSHGRDWLRRFKGWVGGHLLMDGDGGPARPPMLGHIAAAAVVILVIAAFGVFNFQRLGSRQPSPAATPTTTANPAATATPSLAPSPIPTSTAVTPGPLNPPPAGRWQQLAGMGEGRDQFTGTLLRDGRVLIAGGVADTTVAGSATADVEIYDPRTARFTPAASMSVGRAGQTATLLPDGRVLVAGGYTELGNRSQGSVEIYDPVADSWSAGSPMRNGRAQHAAVLMSDGRVLVVGGGSYPAVGIGPGGLAAPSMPPEIYDPSTDTWTDAAMPRWNRPVDPTATLLKDGRVLVVGGQYMWNSPDEDADRSEVYDPASNAWTDVRIDLRFSARQFHTATLLADGRVLVAGGMIDLVPIATAALYDPTTNSWLEVPHMAQVRCGHGAVALPSGNVLVVGSACWARTESNVAEEFDPTTYRWYRVTGLGRGRGDGATVLLQDGTVLYAGGVASGGATTAAQIFHAT